MEQPRAPFAAVILAAGKGTRMKSDLHKVLHPIAGRAMLGHLLDSVDALGPAAKVVVVGTGREQVERLAALHHARIAVQEAQLGTGHAVSQAEPLLDGFAGDVLVLYGDVPLVAPATMARMLARLHADDAPAAVVLAFRPTTRCNMAEFWRAPTGSSTRWSSTRMRARPSAP